MSVTVIVEKKMLWNAFGECYSLFYFCNGKCLSSGWKQGIFFLKTEHGMTYLDDTSDVAAKDVLKVGDVVIISKPSYTLTEEELAKRTRMILDKDNEDYYRNEFRFSVVVVESSLVPKGDFVVAAEAIDEEYLFAEIAAEKTDEEYSDVFFVNMFSQRTWDAIDVLSGCVVKCRQFFVNRLKHKGKAVVVTQKL